MIRRYLGNSLTRSTSKIVRVMIAKLEDADSSPPQRTLPFEGKCQLGLSRNPKAIAEQYQRSNTSITRFEHVQLNVEASLVRILIYNVKNILITSEF